MSKHCLVRSRHVKSYYASKNNYITYIYVIIKISVILIGIKKI